MRGNKYFIITKIYIMSIKKKNKKFSFLKFVIRANVEKTKIAQIHDYAQELHQYLPLRNDNYIWKNIYSTITFSDIKEYFARAIFERRSVITPDWGNELRRPRAADFIFFLDLFDLFQVLLVIPNDLNNDWHLDRLMIQYK